MKNLLYISFLFLNLNSFGQEVFEHEFDENITIDVIEDSEEGEIPNGKFIKGTFGSEIIVYSRSDKGKEVLKNIDESGRIKFIEGMKNGVLKSTKGTLISETAPSTESYKVFSLENVKLFSFKIVFEIEGQKKIVENFNFIYKDSVYTIQFMNDEANFEDNKEFRKQILESIKFN